MTEDNWQIHARLVLIPYGVVLFYELLWMVVHVFLSCWSSKVVYVFSQSPLSGPVRGVLSLACRGSSPIRSPSVIFMYLFINDFTEYNSNLHISHLFAFGLHFISWLLSTSSLWNSEPQLSQACFEFEYLQMCLLRVHLCRKIFGQRGHRNSDFLESNE